ncbi:hypothetical protein D6D22_06877 [Aureobasidium pullulans]|uniref:Isopropylmalate dehydrogenase-like domain-containing protein n=1 Tax=Aureobasidium pullulans TaxID=5580 RepID=A0A4S8XJL1_AURPU|nr:hypothetical protein D6D22_06877 [Aureobasidium pullulans]
MSPSALPATSSYSIATIPADGIGPEVVEAGVEVLQSLSQKLGTFKLDFVNYDWSSETYKKTGKYIPDDDCSHGHEARVIGYYRRHQLAALAGSIGIAPTSNLDPTRENPSMFEPIHGSAFDITGMGISNPVATFWSAAELLDWIGEAEAAKHLLDAVEEVCEKGIVTADLGGKANTKEVTAAVCEEIQNIMSKKVQA